MYVCIYVCMYVCMYMYMYVCMYVYMYVCVYVCSNINAVIRAVSNSLSLFFFYKKILQVQKTPKAPKAQRRNQVKAQSANRRTKAKNALKNI